MTTCKLHTMCLEKYCVQMDLNQILLYCIVSPHQQGFRQPSVVENALWKIKIS